MFHLLAQSAAGNGTAALGIFGAFWGAIMLFYCVFFLVAIVFFVIWIWLLIDCLKRENYDSPNEKLLWALIIIFAGILGAAIYYFVVKVKKDPPKPKAEKPAQGP